MVGLGLIMLLGYVNEIMQLAFADRPIHVPVLCRLLPQDGKKAS